MPDPLASPDSYQTFIYSLPARYSSIRRSTLVYIASGALFGRVEGILFFAPNIALCVQEFLNFELQIIAGYGYEVSLSFHAQDAENLPLASDYCRASYPHKEKLYWYDSFPHPHAPHLAATHPHHKHIPPDIKHSASPRRH